MILRREEVQVLLAVKNGESFLRKQLDSLILQNDVLIHLIVGDSHSADRSMEILSEFHGAFESLTIVTTGNGNACRDFFQLLECARSDLPVAFCDQDDVWNPDKLVRSLQFLQNIDGPGIAWCYWDLIDTHGAHMNEKSKRRTISKYKIHQIFFENPILGCSMVLNAEALSILKKHLSHRAIMHDWWSLLVISAIGKVVCVPDVLLHYRVHDQNTAGMPRFGSHKWFANRTKANWLRLRLEQIRAAYEDYSEIMAPEIRRDFEHLLFGLTESRMGRINFLRKAELVRFRTARLDEFLLRIAFLLL